jgi:hypothetical protein
VLAFVSVNVWRSIISCQIFREAGNVRRKNEIGRASIRQYEFQKPLKELGKLQKKELNASILKDLLTEKWKGERKLCPT